MAPQSLSCSEFFTRFRPLVLENQHALVGVVPDTGNRVSLRLSSGVLVGVQCDGREPLDALRAIGRSERLKMACTEVAPSNAPPLMSDVSWCAWLVTQGLLLPRALPEPPDPPEYELRSYSTKGASAGR